MNAKIAVIEEYFHRSLDCKVLFFLIYFQTLVHLVMFSWILKSLSVSIGDLINKKF